MKTGVTIGAQLQARRASYQRGALADYEALLFHPRHCEKGLHGFVHTFFALESIGGLQRFAIDPYQVLRNADA